MKYLCNYCNGQSGPCVVDVQCVDQEPPYSCIYAKEEADMAAEWNPIAEWNNPIEENKKDFEMNGNISEEIKDKDYRQESIVSKNKIKIDEMINAHWSYIESVIRTSNIHCLYMPPMTLDDALKIREFDYKTAAKHFYGHGHEDGVIDMAKNTVERLRK